MEGSLRINCSCDLSLLFQERLDRLFVDFYLTCLGYNMLKGKYHLIYIFVLFSPLELEPRCRETTMA
jgi:hypothetical protein